MNYLFNFGQAKFRRWDFSDPKNFDYACIELVTSEEIAGNLEEEINRQLQQERARIRFLAIGSKDDKRYKYVAEIIPKEEIPFSEYERVTIEILNKLPKIIKNYRKKNYKSRKK